MKQYRQHMKENEPEKWAALRQKHKEYMKVYNAKKKIEFSGKNE